MRYRHGTAAAACGLVVAALAGCTTDEAIAPSHGNDVVVVDAPTTLQDTVRQLAAARGVTPLERPAAVRPELVRLGQKLVFDKELSGNRDISA